MFSNSVRELWRLSTVRQTLALLAVFATITFLAWGATYLLIQREMLLAVDGRLSERMETAFDAAAKGRSLPALEDGETVEIATDDWPEGFSTRDSEGPGPEMRYLARPVAQGMLVLGENTERQDELRDMLAAGMQVSLFASLLAALLAALWLARSGQKRLDAINAGLAAVADGKLETRIALDGDDDLSVLARRIDATTERLEHAMTQMRVQSSNIAHDLRTPLARLRARIETSLTDLMEGGRPVALDDLGAALEQIDEINAAFDALLRLARIENEARRDAFAPVDLGALCRKAAETFAPVIEESGQSLALRIGTVTPIEGDYDLLSQMLSNLIGNALRYGPTGQAITIIAEAASVSIVDQGPGIPVGEREDALQPLYQAETSRHGPGYGLGLSMVRAIAELHGATLTLSDGPGGVGLNVSIAFPAPLPAAS